VTESRTVLDRVEVAGLSEPAIIAKPRGHQLVRLNAYANAGISTRRTGDGETLGRLSFRVAKHAVDSGVMPEITRLLEAAAAGDRQAAADLLPLVYDELRKLAAARMAAERPGHTLDATALVHEAYLRLIGDKQFDGKSHFFAAAAEAMRRVLVNHARDRARLKRGGRRNWVDLAGLTGPAAASDDELLELDEALERLATEFPVAAELVKLRFFAGMTLGNAAEALGIPRRTADRKWAFARAWLADALGSG
jgi:RNA polymerase sigma factor (TIGR02999 family)